MPHRGGSADVERGLSGRMKDEAGTIEQFVAQGMDAAERKKGSAGDGTFLVYNTPTNLTTFGSRSAQAGADRTMRPPGSFR